MFQAHVLLRRRDGRSSLRVALFVSFLLVSSVFFFSFLCVRFFFFGSFAVVPAFHGPALFPAARVKRRKTGLRDEGHSAERKLRRCFAAVAGASSSRPVAGRQHLQKQPLVVSLFDGRRRHLGHRPHQRPQPKLCGRRRERDSCAIFRRLERRLPVRRPPSATPGPLALCLPAAQELRDAPPTLGQALLLGRLDGGLLPR